MNRGNIKLDEKECNVRLNEHGQKKRMIERKNFADCVH